MTAIVDAKDNQRRLQDVVGASDAFARRKMTSATLCGFVMKTWIALMLPKQGASFPALDGHERRALEGLMLSVFRLRGQGREDP